MKDHIHTDDCWEPDSGCDMGRNEKYVGVCSEEETKQINDAIDQYLNTAMPTSTPPAYIIDKDTRYNEQFDCYYNVHSREWLEQKCSDQECEFCSVRPEKAPLEG